MLGVAERCYEKWTIVKTQSHVASVVLCVVASCNGVLSHGDMFYGDMTFNNTRHSLVIIP